jgi:DtxR family Mn-dependent transcriptional regulator
MSEGKLMERSLSIAQERYVEAILDAEESHGHAHISMLSEALDVRKPSVVQMTARLEKKGIVKRNDKEVTLTPKGKGVALELQGRHEALQRFMQEKLGMNPARANQEACRLEHVVSGSFMRGLRSLLAAES